METNVSGVYAAGDIVTYPGKLKLIATGFGEAATAVNNAARYINPEASVFPGHSSAIMERKEKKEAAAHRA
jgi:thioredoxin reductase (NADPH)